MRSKQLLFQLLALAMLASCQSVIAQMPTQDSQIQVQIDGLRNNRGQVRCSLFSSPVGFPKDADKATAHAESAISDGRALCHFSGVTPGKYAISIFHDENSNGKLDTNFMGIPREGVGASNNAKGHFGPPTFGAAAFSFAGGPLELKITIYYL